MSDIKLYDPDRACWYWINSQGQYHREDGPAIEYNNGDKYWYRNDQRHREDGPAIEWADGDKEWYLNGRRHRGDGPAIEFSNGHEEWWYHGKRISCKSREEFEKLIKLQVFW